MEGSLGSPASRGTGCRMSPQETDSQTDLEVVLSTSGMVGFHTASVLEIGPCWKLFQRAGFKFEHRLINIRHSQHGVAQVADRLRLPLHDGGSL